ncbi:MAG: hypothetical protein KDD82_02340 [Planctomycetes bacterium]|nr:hypothetical protein [Planctomycetota bacterium]
MNHRALLPLLVLAFSPLTLAQGIAPALGAAPPSSTAPQLVFDLGWEPDAGRGLWGTIFRGQVKEADHTFFDLPFPLDSRRLENGAPSLEGLPIPYRSRYLPVPRKKRFVRIAFRSAQTQTTGFSPSGAIYFRFDGPINSPVDDPLVSQRPDAQVFLVDIDPQSPEYLSKRPIHVAVTQRADSFRQANTLQMLPVPGLGLRPNTTYAAIVLRSLGAPGQATLGQPAELATLLRGGLPTPSGAAPSKRRKAKRWAARVAENAAGLQAAYAPLVAALPALGLSPDAIAAATVYTTGDPARRLIDAVDQVKQLPPLPVKTLERRTDRDNPVFNALRGTYRVPQYQEGNAPYLVGSGVPTWVSRLRVGKFTLGKVLGNGSFRYDAQGKLVEVRKTKTNFEISVPKGVMPARGFPLHLYVHGTGGTADEGLDRGRKTVSKDEETPGQGYSMIVGKAGWASATVATGFSPDRVGIRAGDGYLGYNFLNTEAMRDNFIQMVLELVHFRALLLDLEIDPALCPGTDASAGPGGKVRFDPDLVVVNGQSLGSYLSGMLTATLGGFKGTILTGAGGSWIEFPFGPKKPFPLINVVDGLLFTKSQIKQGKRLDRFHPLLMMFDLAIGPADNAHIWRHVLNEPLPGRTPPHVLVIGGHEDLQVAIGTQRALILGIGVDMVGPDVGPTPADRLTPILPWIGGRELPYGVSNNRLLPNGLRRTSAVVRYEADAIQGDGHLVVFQLLEPQRQLVAFLEDLEAGRAPRVIDPSVVTTASNP